MYLFKVEAKYDISKKTYILDGLNELKSNFPFLDEKIIIGKFISTHRDGRIKRINKDFKCKLNKIEGFSSVLGEILEPNPLKAIGLPLPSPLLVAVYKYEEENEQGKAEHPIAEDIILKSYNISPFEDEVKKILREEEAGLILEGTIFHQRLEKYAPTLKKALISFEQEDFASAKTFSRKTLEEIKRIVNDWKTVDESESLCEKLKPIVSSLYSFASIGGAHEGIATKEETELILKCTTSLLFYINFLLKNQKVSESL